MPEALVDVHYDVVILGAGLAGLTLARQLLMYSDKKILLVERRAQIPPRRQKVGESNVQVQGYYLSKILDLEEYLCRQHFMKYNLRFYWKTPGRDNNCYEDISQSYIRNFSNVGSYQLDRNKIEAELLRLNLEDPKFSFVAGITDPDVELSSGCTPHAVSFDINKQHIRTGGDWVVDTTGRSKFLARRLGLTKSNVIRHGAVFFWTEGLFNIEKLTPLSHPQRLLHKNRKKLGHLPVWLATNHFCGEGYWFWVIPLQGKTSFGLVYDRDKVPEDLLTSPEKVMEWVCREYPLFAPYLPKEKIIDWGMIRDFSYDCQQTVSSGRWALAGEAGRFTDPLYSPGGDLISLYNTLITDAILTPDSNSLAIKVRLYEILMWALYEAYVPSYAVGYEVLGDQECFAMKYSWELTTYFTFYVFPFINHLFTETAFVVPYLDLFAKLGAWNHKIQAFVRDYYRWKKCRPPEPPGPIFFDFTGFEALKRAEELFYEVGLGSSQAIVLLTRHMANIQMLGRFIVIYIYSVVLDDESLLSNKHLIETIRLENLRFDPDGMRQECSCLNKEVDHKFTKAASEFITQFRRSSGRSVVQTSLTQAVSVPAATLRDQ